MTVASQTFDSVAAGNRDKPSMSAFEVSNFAADVDGGACIDEYVSIDFPRLVGRVSAERRSSTFQEVAQKDIRCSLVQNDVPKESSMAARQLKGGTVGDGCK